jgi:hypothetical protein
MEGGGRRISLLFSAFCENGQASVAGLMSESDRYPCCQQQLFGKEGISIGKFYT